MNQVSETQTGNVRQTLSCWAMTRAGTACQEPAIQGQKRCRLHGGLSPGAPHGHKKREFSPRAPDSRSYRGAPVAAVSRAVVCQNRDEQMTTKTKHIPSAGKCGRLPPVRVKLLRPDAYVSQTCPPDGESGNWHKRLQNALGTMSGDFVTALCCKYKRRLDHLLAPFRKSTSMPPLP